MNEKDQIHQYHLQSMPLPKKTGISDACLINKHPVFYQQKFLCWGYLPDHLVLEFLVTVNEISPSHSKSDTSQRLLNVMAYLKKNYPTNWH